MVYFPEGTGLILSSINKRDYALFPAILKFCMNISKSNCRRVIKRSQLLILSNYVRYKSESEL